MTGFPTGARHDMSYTAEFVYGEFPTSPTPIMSRLRHTSTSLNLARTLIQSEELRSDREIVDARLGNNTVGGDIAFELSYGALDDILESALYGTWATNILINGVVERPLSIERRFDDITQFLLYKGCLVNQMSMAIAVEAIVTGTFTIVGSSLSASTTGQTAPVDVATNAPFDTFTGSLLEGGSAIASVTSIEFTVDNGLEPAFVVGSQNAPCVIPSRRNITGTLSAYFEDVTLLNKFINETESAIALTLSDVPGNTLLIEFPRIKYTGGDIPAQDGGLQISMPFQALRDSSEETSIKLTRTPL